jgi:hypothetical protein
MVQRPVLAAIRASINLFQRVSVKPARLAVGPDAMLDREV